MTHDPVKIDFGNESIWFTQTHIAEIRELMALKDAADEYVEPASKPIKKAEPVISSMNSCRSYASDRILRYSDAQFGHMQMMKPKNSSLKLN